MGHIPLADTAYLKRRCGKGRSGYRWYVRVNVPTDLRETLGARTIERALNTSDFNEAKKLKHAALADIFSGFERARQRQITSQDIEHEAQRYLRERLEVLRTRPGDAFNSNDYELPIETALATLHEARSDEDWSGYTEIAASIARRYGTDLTGEQERELCRALLFAEIEAHSRALTIHNGEVPQPAPVLNVHAVDPITAELAPRAVLPARQGKGLRVGEAAKAYVTDRNRERRNAWTGQTLGPGRSDPSLFGRMT